VRRSIATVCLSGSLEEKLRAAAAAGFDGVELFEPDLIASPLSPAAVRALLAELGLTLDLYQPLRDFEAVPEPDFARAEAKLALMQELGAELLLVCSNVREDAIDDDALAAEQLRELARRADARGIRIAYEALAWGTHVDDYEHSLRIVERADHPALGTCIDSFHVLSRGDRPRRLNKLFFVQLADAPRLDMGLLQWSRHHRCFPGQGGFDLHDFVATVLAAGYTGPLSLEVFNDVFRATDPTRTALDAMRSLRALDGSLPEAPPLGGFAYVEVAGEPPFAHEAVRVVDGDSGIAGFGVVSADPERSARRAQELGTSVGFGSERACIDHLTLALPFDEAALEFRAALDLRPCAGEEVVSPDGLVHSRAFERDGVRLAFNAPVLNGHGPRLEHVAFACDDARAAARELREDGVALLDIPGNYYDDLEARWQIDTGELRELGLLYDRDSGGGELLHAFTRASGHVFFEVLERRGGYSGYGAANTPIRMAAQREET
jgi:4-hydroxyphenylpyruvate dioxygenase